MNVKPNSLIKCEIKTKNTNYHGGQYSYLKCSVEPNNYLEFLECLTFNDFTLSK